jgi:hypothetical protein
MVALVVRVCWFYSRTVGCDIQKAHGNRRADWHLQWSSMLESA